MTENRIHRRLNRKALVAAALVASSSFFLTACSPSADMASSRAAAGNFSVLLLASESGSGAAVGGAWVAATKAAMDVINASGGADHRQMTLKVIDDASDPQIGVTAMQTELASGATYDLIIPGTTGAIASAVEPTIANNPALQMSSAFLDDPQKYPRYFSTGGPKSQTQVVQDYVRSQGYKHVGVLAVDNATSRAVVNLHEQLAAKSGVAVTSAFVPSTTGDATAQLQQLIDSGADALIFAGFDPQTASVSLINAKVKVSPSIPIIADQTFSANQLKAAGVTGDQLTGIHVQLLKTLVKGTEPAESDLMKSYLTALDKYSDGKQLPLAVTMIQTMTLAIAADGATAAGSVDGQTIASKLENIRKDELPHSLGPGNPFSASTHAQHFTSDDYVFLPMTVDTDSRGFTIPGSK